MTDSGMTPTINGRTAEMAIDYDDDVDLVAKLRQIADGIESGSKAVTVNHPEWFRSRWNCCGGSGP